MKIEVLSPGELIRQEICERGWTQGDLAEILGLPIALVNQVVNDRRGITPRTAMALGAAFGTSAESWMTLYNAYRLAKVKAKLAEKEGKP